MLELEGWEQRADLESMVFIDQWSREGLDEC